MATINPFQAPINYAVDVQSPFEAALGGFKLGAAGAEAQAQAQAREQAIKAQSELKDLFSNPNASATDFARVAAVLPKDQAETVRKSFEMMSTSQQQNRLSQSGQIYAAMKSGQPDIAKSLLQEQADAFRNSGREQEAKAAETYLQLIDMNPTGSQATIGLMMASLPGGKEMLENIDKTLATQRAEAQGKPTLEKLEQEAISAGVEAEFARPLAQANLAKLNREKLAPSVQEAIDYQNLTPEQKALFSNLQILKKPPAPVTNVNVSNVIDKSASAELGRLVPDLYNQANASAAFLTDIPRYKKALDSAITGPMANELLAAARVSSALGFGGEKGINATTEVIKGLSKMTLDGRKTMRGEGAITESEGKLAERAFSGDISLTKSELMQLFGSAERAAKFQYKQSKQLLSSTAKQSPTAGIFLENLAEPPTTESVTVGGKTYERPSNFTDAQWSAYKQSAGVK